MEKFEIVSDPKLLYKKMLEDIKNAKKSIYLETYIYDRDEIGKKFKEALIKKATEGIKIKLLLDSWGSTVDENYFQRLINLGAEVKFFREFQYVLRIFSKNHERNHRKLLIIDENISYIGSANITASCLEWRELNMRVEDDISKSLIDSFEQNWSQFKTLEKKFIRKILHEDFEILQDRPSKRKRTTEKKYLELLKNAKKEILIETPYFVPSYRIRRALYNAVRRKVKVKLILPYRSDLEIMNIIRNRYLGKLYEKGIEIYYYVPKTLHSKLLIIDDSFFLLGSSNLDHRSFIHQYELNLFGVHPGIIADLKKHFNSGIKDSIPFNYHIWKNRSSITKIFELLLNTVRNYL